VGTTSRYIDLPVVSSAGDLVGEANRAGCEAG
jgi:hypothetical protein